MSAAERYAPPPPGGHQPQSPAAGGLAPYFGPDGSQQTGAPPQAQPGSPPQNPGYPEGQYQGQAQPQNQWPFQQPPNQAENQWFQQGQNPYQQQVIVTPVGTRSSGMAIAGFVLSFFCGLLGLIFSIIGYNECQNSNGEVTGSGLAMAGIIISIVSMVLGLALAIGS